MEMILRIGNLLPRIQMLVFVLCLHAYAAATFLEVSGLTSSVDQGGFAHEELHDHDSSTQMRRKCSSLQDNFRDAVALLQFKESISCDAKGVLDGWNSSNFSSYCSWMGVTCDIDQLHVVSVRLPDLSLCGSLSSAIANLSYLEELDLSLNHLQKEIPPELGQLGNLRFLNLDKNRLVGEIPREFGNLTKLQELNLGAQGSWFNGSIPEELGLLTELEILNLGTLNNLELDKVIDYNGIPSNRLKGPLPRSLGNCTKLRYLDFYGSSLLSGKIPEEYGQLINLNHLSFEQNNLTGIVPYQLGNLTKLRFLNFGYNRFQDRLPPELAQLSQLEVLNLGYNSFSGNFIEVNSTSWSILRMLFLTGNLFDGKFPEVLTTMGSLEILHLDYNYFTGELPTSLNNLKNLTSLVLSNNQFDGQISEGLTRLSKLEVLDLGYNSLSGDLAHIDFGQLPALRSFSVNVNKFDGDFPSRILQCTQLELLDLSENQLSGGITSGAAFTHHLPSLRVLSLASNNLNGAIPAWIWNLTALQVLDLSFNGFSGQLPNESSALQSFNISRNDRIPATQRESKTRSNDQMSITVKSNTLVDERMSMTVKSNTLVYEYVLLTSSSLDLSSNRLSGELPGELGSLQGLMFLNLANNSLGGSITTFGNLSQLYCLDLSMNEFSGPIPPFLNISPFGHLNFSLNNLSGPIPEKFWFRSANSFWPGNPDLCAIVLDKPCSTSPPQSPGTTTSTYFVDDTFKVAAGTGFVVGFFVVFAPLLLIDELRRKFYVLEPLAGPRNSALYRVPR